MVLVVRLRAAVDEGNTKSGGVILLETLLLVIEEPCAVLVVVLLIMVRHRSGRLKNDGYLGSQVNHTLKKHPIMSLKWPGQMKSC